MATLWPSIMAMYYQIENQQFKRKKLPKNLHMSNIFCIFVVDLDVSYIGADSKVKYWFYHFSRG